MSQTIYSVFGINTFSKKYPNYLLSFAKGMNVLNTGFIGLGMLKNREISVKDALVVVKQFGLSSSVSILMQLKF